MYDYISGKIEKISPTSTVLDVQGVGYFIHISVHTFEQIKEMPSVKLLTHLVVREDSHTLFGFFTEDERIMFQKLINVNGVGTATARMILSALSVNELVSAISNGNIGLLKTVKGIGPKAAQRLIVELQDKVGSLAQEMSESMGEINYHNLEEAAAALVALGFAKPNVHKVLLKLSKDLGNNAKTEDLIKKSLQIL